MDMPKLDIPVNIGGGNALGAYSTGGGGGGMGGNNGAIPLATFEPMMPRKAALAGLASGKVLVEFTVTERGTVSNVRIVKEIPAATTSAGGPQDHRQMDVQAGHGRWQAAGHPHAARNRVCGQLRKVAMKSYIP